MEVLQEIIAPLENVSDETVNVVLLCAEPGSKVEPGITIIELETSKAVFTIESEVEGYIEYLVKEGEDIPVGETLIRIWNEVPDRQLIEINQQKTKNEESDIEPYFSNAANQLLAEREIDSGRFANVDFVTSRDVRSFLGEVEEPIGNSRSIKDTTKMTVSRGSISSSNESVEFVELSADKSREIKYLSDVQGGHLGSDLSIYVNIRGIFAAINRSMRYFQDSLLPIVVYEAARLLKKYKELNGFYAGSQLGFYKDVHIGIAVDNEKGLKVVKVPDADQKSVQQIENELFDLVNRYLDDNLMLSEITGTTFTVTDLSVQGISFFKPLINTRQSAILGISGVDEQLLRCILTLTFDHRVTEGRKAGEFLAELKKRIESYALSDLDDEDSTREQNTIDLCCDMCMKNLIEDKERLGPGFLKVIDHTGKEKMLCKSCFQGW